MQSKESKQSVGRTISRTLSEEVTIFLMVFIVVAVAYAIMEGLGQEGALALAPLVGWAVLAVLCTMRYRIAFLVAAIFGVFGSIGIFAGGASSIQYDVIANFLVLPFGLRAYREMK